MEILKQITYKVKNGIRRNDIIRVYFHTMYSSPTSLQLQISSQVAGENEQPGTQRIPERVPLFANTPAQCCRGASLQSLSTKCWGEGRREGGLSLLSPQFVSQIRTRFLDFLQAVQPPWVGMGEERLYPKAWPGWHQHCPLFWGVVYGSRPL